MSTAVWGVSSLESLSWNRSSNSIIFQLSGIDIIEFNVWSWLHNSKRGGGAATALIHHQLGAAYRTIPKCSLIYIK